ncbi:pyoverdine/dityrosine biosynthesis protein [Zalerion maritima]|uniref:Pyoverdine/dityrosine biosynthesis protein n=1 Tax=Zalerion maritima TaxID=339359 RepID=A0AAD5RQD7_9PEZI|nr:pyoverdine/dityrosine biosynthesis protein [Zalerion maritima]
MHISNEGSSIFHRLLGIFQSTAEGNLLFATNEVVNQEWPIIRAALPVPEANSEPHDSKLAPTSTSLELPGHGAVATYTSRQRDTVSIVGLILSKDFNSDQKFEEFFVNILLTQLRLCVATKQSSHKVTSSNTASITTEIVDLFDTKLRYAGVNDQWNTTGREFFTARVCHFVEQGIQLELCLPAFPCKSSNTDKVLGALPDRGEMMALEWLHSFVEAVEQIYSPGAKLWIVSDGHVFSDCIGADDGKVDAYTARLKELNHRISKSGRIGFKSLADIFSLSSNTSSIPISDLAQHLNLPEIPHHVATDIAAEAELCRRILMSGSHADRQTVRRRIEGQDKSILALYRGFSRFMLEDLELHPATKVLSKTKRRKIATAVGFEMILRNQAYSNLVEMIFPNHIRLSIHASRVRTTSSLSTLATTSKADGGAIAPQQCTDLLHIPTPWHNCVVELPLTLPMPSPTTCAAPGTPISEGKSPETNAAQSPIWSPPPPLTRIPTIAARTPTGMPPTYTSFPSPGPTQKRTHRPLPVARSQSQPRPRSQVQTQYLVTKAKTVRAALERGDFAGGIEGGELQRHFKLRSVGANAATAHGRRPAPAAHMERGNDAPTPATPTPDGGAKSASVSPSSFSSPLSSSSSSSSSSSKVRKPPATAASCSPSGAQEEAAPGKSPKPKPKPKPKGLSIVIQNVKNMWIMFTLLRRRQTPARQQEQIRT